MAEFKLFNADKEITITKEQFLEVCAQVMMENLLLYTGPHGYAVKTIVADVAFELFDKEDVIKKLSEAKDDYKARRDQSDEHNGKTVSDTGRAEGSEKPV
jgi:hypothetical protein